VREAAARATIDGEIGVAGPTATVPRRKT